MIGWVRAKVSYNYIAFKGLAAGGCARAWRSLELHRSNSRNVGLGVANVLIPVRCCRVVRMTSLDICFATEILRRNVTLSTPFYIVQVRGVCEASHLVIPHLCREVQIRGRSCTEWMSSTALIHAPGTLPRAHVSWAPSCALGYADRVSSVSRTHNSFLQDDAMLSDPGDLIVDLTPFIQGAGEAWWSPEAVSAGKQPDMNRAHIQRCRQVRGHGLTWA
jgi:hypothetical protein